MLINKFVDSVADSNKSVLVEGELGTGKELLARLIHSSSLRKKGPFVEVDCSFFSPESWGDELFGLEQEEGGFYKIRHRGFVEKADGGILYLKNVDQLNAACQVKFFNFLQSGLFNRVGSNMQHRANIRVISTSSGDLKSMVSSGSYNKNTYEVLSTFSFKLEPLRKMKRDIPELCNYLFKRIGRQIRREGLSLSESAEKRILAYDWPGNVAELENVLKGAAILSPENTIEAKRLFFPSRAPGDKPVYNLLSHSSLSKLLGGKIFPDSLSKIILAGFGITVFLLLAFPGANLINSLIWSLGWFLLFLSAFILGRVFCAVCPFMRSGEIAQNWTSLQMSRPGIVSTYGEGLALSIFFIMLWLAGAFTIQ